VDPVLTGVTQDPAPLPLPSAARARVVLVREDPPEVVVVEVVGVDEPCDLVLVDRLLRLRLEAVRHGDSLELRDVDPELRLLLHLVGVAALMLGG
jgi:hypothetical protein